MALLSLKKIKVRIDTNYDLWMALGGEFSVSRDGKTLKRKAKSSLDKANRKWEIKVAFK